MNAWTEQFRNWHGMDIKTDKSRFVGVDTKGADLSTTVVFNYTGRDGKEKPIKAVTSATPIKYLGLWVTLTLDWTRHVRAMTSTVLSITTRLHRPTFCLSTALMLVRDVLIPRLGTGLAHCYFPASVVKKWDTAVTRGVRRCMGTAKPLHPAAIPAIMGWDNITSAYYTFNTYNMLLLMNSKPDGVHQFPV